MTSSSITLLSSLAAEQRSPLVFLASEFWGDRVVERWDGNKGRHPMRKTQPRLEIVPPFDPDKPQKTVQTAREKMITRNQEVDELLRITASHSSTTSKIKNCLCNLTLRFPR